MVAFNTQKLLPSEIKSVGCRTQSERPSSAWLITYRANFSPSYPRSNFTFPREGLTLFLINQLMHLNGHGLLRAQVFCIAKIILCRSGFNILVKNCFLIHNKPPIFTLSWQSNWSWFSDCWMDRHGSSGKNWVMLFWPPSVSFSIKQKTSQLLNMNSLNIFRFLIPWWPLSWCADRLQRRGFPTGHSILQV